MRDEDKRGRFDRGEIEANGAERAQRHYYRDFADADAGASGGAYGNAEGFADFGAEDIFADFFSRRRRGPHSKRGADVRYAMEIDFLEAANGGTRQVTLPEGQTLDIRIPPGARDGQTLRLRGKGGVGEGGVEAGDALIELHVRSHPFYRRDGDDIRLDLPISLREVGMETTSASISRSRSARPCWAAGSRCRRRPVRCSHPCRRIHRADARCG